MKLSHLAPIVITVGIGSIIISNLPPNTPIQIVQGDVCSEVKRVIDGDTFVCSNDVRIRLCGIDSPEVKQQPLGLEAKQALSILLPVGQAIKVLAVDTDKYGRVIAEVTTDQNVNVAMVREGKAYHYVEYSSTCPSKTIIAAAEVFAKANNLGVWANKDAVKPWDWRKEQKKKVA